MKISQLSLGEKLKDLRNEKNISQKELSESTGISINTISNLENNKYNGHQETIELLAKFYNVTIEYLVNKNCTIKNPDFIEISKKYGIEEKAINNMIFYYDTEYSDNDDIPDFYYDELNEGKRKILNDFLINIDLNDLILNCYQSRILSKLEKLNKKLLIYSKLPFLEEYDIERYRTNLIEEINNFKKKSEIFEGCFEIQHGQTLDAFFDKSTEFLCDEEIKEKEIEKLYYDIYNHIYEIKAKNKYLAIKALDNYMNNKKEDK